MTAGEDTLWYIFTFVIGGVFGSFLNVVGYRVPRKQSIVRPGSHCPHCKRQLRMYELIPVFSWLALQGKCRTCGWPIPSRYPLIELATASLFAGTYLYQSHWSIRIGWMVFWLILVAAVATDLYAMKVPNVLSIPGAVVVYAVSVSTGMETWRGALLGIVVCFLLLLLIHLISGGRMGMGDAKLYLAIGAALGALEGVESLVLASFYGSIIGLALRLSGRIGKREFIPFVPFIAMGVITMLFWGNPLNHWYFYDVLHLD